MREAARPALPARHAATSCITLHASRARRVTYPDAWGWHMGLFQPLIRWIFVLVGALAGSYGGRAAVMRPDMVPGFVAVELVGKVIKLGPLSAALVAGAATATSAFLEGPFAR